MKNNLEASSAFWCLTKAQTSRLLGSAVLVSCFSALFGQQEVKFTHLSNMDGLSQSTVQAIVKDKYGFMWFGTQDGLNRYDGYEFKIYRHKPKDTTSLERSHIMSLYEDRQGNLWVGNFNGALSLYNRKNDAFTHYKLTNGNTNGLSDKTATTIYEDKQANLWIGTYYKLNLLDRKTGLITHFGNDPADPASISDNGINCIFEDRRNTLWIGTSNGLNILDRKTKKFKRIYASEAPNSLSNNHIKAIHEDDKGNLWIGTENGLNRYHPETGTFTRFLNNPADPTSLGNNDITHIEDAGVGRLWIGTSEVLHLFYPAQHRFYRFTSDPNNPSTLSKNGNTTALLRDNTGIVWVGTYGGGINKYDEHLSYFETQRNRPSDWESLSFNVVAAFAENSDGNVWVATDGGALNLWKKDANKFIRYNPDPANENSIGNWGVLSLCQAKKRNYLWIGFYGKGLDRYDATTGTFRHYTKGNGPGQLNNDQVYALAEDRQGNIWIGTNGNGVNILNPATNKIIKYVNDPANPASLTGDYVRCLYEDKKGRMWIGTSVGISVYDPARQSCITYNHTNIEMETDDIHCITEDKKGNIWIGTLGGGLTVLDSRSGQSSMFTTANGLPDNTINSIVEDDQGFLWISTNNGLSRYDPANGSFKNSSLEDGIQSFEFSQNAGFKTSDGTILMGGVNGFNVIRPKKLIVNKNIPPVCITGFKLFNKKVRVGAPGSPLQHDILETDTIRLTYNQSIFSFEFAALSYTAPGKNRYAYMLEGFDKEWIYAGTNRSATYTNLNPGTYRFKVKAANNDGIWNATGASIVLLIQPPFWQTWWFRLTVIVVFATVVILTFRGRTREISNRNEWLEKQVLERTQSLANATLAAQETAKELERKNKELEQFAYVASHDMQEPLRTMSSFVELLQQQYKDTLDDNAEKYMSFIVHACDRMRVLINDLLDYSRIGKKKSCSLVDCNVLVQEVLADLNAAISEAGATVKVGPLPVVYGYATELKQLFQNLIVNAIKFRKKDTDPLVELTAVQQNDAFQFAVADNGIGIDPKFHERIFVIFQRLHTRAEYTGSGIGLSNCKKITELHKGDIWVDSEIGAGTTFYFTLPVNQKEQLLN
jgi:ligand-binding sensor domain-containing protein/signal transduction histidine kinase